MKHLVKTPERLSKAALVNLVGALQEFMYYEMYEKGPSFWDPNKETNGGDLVEFVDGLMQENGLYPIPQGPKDWSPKEGR